MGASYDGYEDKVLEVLMTIDARHRRLGLGSRKSTP